MWCRHVFLTLLPPALRLTHCHTAFRACTCLLRLQDGLKRCVNAVDLVHAVTALLECGSRKGPVTNFGDHVDKFWWVKMGGGYRTVCCGVNMYWAGRAKDASLQMLHTHVLAPLPPADVVSANAMLSCPGRRAYHALSWGSDDGELRRGLELAKKVQQALINGEAGRRQAGRVGWGGVRHANQTAWRSAATHNSVWFTSHLAAAAVRSPASPADGGAVLQQRHYHNFKQFRIFDLSDHKMTSQHLIVSAGRLCVGVGGCGKAKDSSKEWCAGSLQVCHSRCHSGRRGADGGLRCQPRLLTRRATPWRCTAWQASSRSSISRWAAHCMALHGHV